MRISVLSIIIGTVFVCWLAVWMPFSGQFYYFTEHTSTERLQGVVERLNAEPLYQSDDGAVNRGYFLLHNRVEQRINMPPDWDGKFGTVELPIEASDLPHSFLALVQMNVCLHSQWIEEYVEDDVSFEVAFLDATDHLVERVSGDSPTCR